MLRSRLCAFAIAAATVGDLAACEGEFWTRGFPGTSSSSDPRVTTLAFTSGTAWSWYPGGLEGIDGGVLGNAAVVCLNWASPVDCPEGAILYGWSGTQWSSAATAMPNAQWIWRGDVTAAAVTDLDLAVFQKTFTLGSNPTGSIQIAADNFAEVRVNGVTAATVGSVTDEVVGEAVETQLTTIDLSPYLVPGTNTITIVGENGPSIWARCSGTCFYAQNPAGVIFEGSLTSH